VELDYMKVEHPNITAFTNLREKQPKRSTVSVEKPKTNFINTKVRV